MLPSAGVQVAKAGIFGSLLIWALDSVTLPEFVRTIV